MKNHLTELQRYEIYLALTKRKWSYRRIAQEINVSVSTISREIKRNSTARGNYLWKDAQRRADERKHSYTNHRKSEVLWLIIEDLLCNKGWSPEQIVGVLRKQGVQICKQTIYNHIHQEQTGKLADYLPHKLKYKRRMRQQPVTKATNIPNRHSIHDRPPEADGTRFGDWEMDTIIDGYGHAILTLTERSTNYILMARLPQGKKAEPAAKIAVRLLAPVAKTIHTITTDNGSEFAAHELITKLLRRRGKDDVIVYFADAYSSWQKGAIENANKLIRRYIPKRANFNDFSDKYLQRVQNALNNRPRKKLNYNTPINAFWNNIT